MCGTHCVELCGDARSRAHLALVSLSTAAYANTRARRVLCVRAYASDREHQDGERNMCATTSALLNPECCDGRRASCDGKAEVRGLDAKEGFADEDAVNGDLAGQGPDSTRSSENQTGKVKYSYSYLNCHTII